jgi:HD-like signal output (HDOD) protein
MSRSKPLANMSNLRLPILSEPGMQLIDSMAEKEISLSELSSLVLKDPVLASTLIKYANSPLYRARGPEVTNVRAALGILGYNNVRNAVVVVAMRSFLQPAKPELQSILRHSLDIASLSRAICLRYDKRMLDDIELFALLHDIGMLVLFTNYPDSYGSLIKTAIESETPIDQIEQERFGISHFDILSLIARPLRLPVCIIRSSRVLHSRKKLERLENRDDEFAAITGLAHLLESRAEGSEQHLPIGITNSQEELGQLIGLLDADVENILEDYTEASLAR